MICVISVERAIREGMNSGLLARIADWHAEKARVALVPHNGRKLSESKRAERRERADRHHYIERALRSVADDIERLSETASAAAA